MACLTSLSAAAAFLSAPSSQTQASGGITSAFPALGSSNALVASHLLRPTPPQPAALRLNHSMLVQAAQRRGTQIVRRGKKQGGGSGEEAKGTSIFQALSKGTTVLRLGGSKGAAAEDGAGAGGTKKVQVNTKPEEVSAAPPGLFDGLAKLPFAGLFRGRQADPKTVFVAGATGLTGSRLILELLAAGFSVRAGVEDLQGAQRLAELASEYRQVVTPEDAKRLNFVQCSTANPEFTAKAIANAGRLVLALGPGESGPKSALSPAQALVLLEAAQLAKTPYVVLVAGLAKGDASPGGIFAAIVGFFASLGKSSVSVQSLISALVDSGVRYTVVRTGSRDVPDSAAASSGLVLAPEGALPSGSISRLQVAQLVAGLMSNVEAGANKIFDVVAKEGVEAVPVDQLLQAIPVDGRREAKEQAAARAEAAAREREVKEAAAAEARAVAAQARAAAQSLAELEEEAKKVDADEAKAAAAAVKAQARAQAAAASVADLASSLKDMKLLPGTPAAPARSPALPVPKSVIPSFASLVPSIPPPTPSPVAAAAAAAAAAASASFARVTASSPSAPSDSVKTRRPLRQRTPKPAPAPAPAAPPPPPSKPVEKKKLLGGLLQQETIYMDSQDGDF